ncbi:BON domain-containing protein [Starkeya sp. ORNL1]|uniref:BON domain-containing protein n=1 Tax=Starkeya sp. ORNL1 TaxID=2709380 RepID=UPI001463A38E|nr:BON domain-containing protein [Starkeya sp. ORNL1]QJP15726.1 BON domain-containing protein [Starkeya sp. ORNL1]
MNDKQLRLIITDELDFEPSVDASHINVAVGDGAVTLTGHVRSHAEKRAAKKAACRVKSVRFVTEQIEVSCPSGKILNDAEITRRSRNTLEWDERVPSGVKVGVKKGWVELGGTVDWHYQRQAAESAVGRLSGVVGVTNLIELRPCADAAYDIGKAIEAALSRSAELEARAIRVIVKNGNMVTLEGKVSTWLERSAAERAAWSAPGVLAVEDLLVVS